MASLDHENPMHESATRASVLNREPMRFRVDRDRFAEAVTWAGRTVPARPTAPMLSGLRLEALADAKACLRVESYDFEVSGRAEIAADVEVPGVALVNGRLLVDIAKALPAQPVDVEVEGTRMAVRCGRSSFALPTLPVEDYPNLPPMPEPNGTVPGPVLASAVSQVAVAAGRDDTLAFLTGVRVEVDGDSVTLAATDRYRLAVRTFNWTPRDPQFTAAALVPARTLADTSKSLMHADEVRLAFSLASAGEGLLGIEGLDRRTTTRLLNGDFPKFRDLLPKQPSTVARVETAALTEAVKRVSLVAERSSAVRLIFSGQEVVLEAGTGDDALGTDAIECELQGESMERIAFNAAYLLEGLAAIGKPVTMMSFTEPGKAAVLTGSASFDADAVGDYKYLLMPIRLPA
ncbi:MAG: DNA polymerase III subunit beta [Candidatus Nanopelagicales bacterium]